MSLAFRTTRVASAATKPTARLIRPAVRPCVMTRSTPDPKVLEAALKEAEDACKGGSSGACAAAWDNVEEISAAISHGKVQEAENSDPLEKFCETNPDADECRVYSD